MNINRKTYRDGNLYPAVLNYLKLLPDEVLFHSEYSEYHPYSIYHRSLQKIVRAFKNVLDEMDNISQSLLDSKENFTYRLEKLPGLQEELLYSTQSHFDDCYRVLKTLHPPINSTTRNAEQWLEAAKHPTYKDFRNNVKTYKESFALIINKIKHGGALLRPVVIFARGKGVIVTDMANGFQQWPKNFRISGYFLEGMQPDGAVGPDPEIHQEGKVAISLNHDLRFHFANLYRVAHHLRSAVVRAVRKTHSIELAHPGKIEGIPHHDELETLARRVSEIPSFFFQNEFRKPTPIVNYRHSSRSSELILEFPGTRKVVWAGDTSVYGEFQVDAVSNSYRVPYM